MSTFTSEPGTRLAGRYLLVDQTAAGHGWTMWKAQDETLARAVSVLTFAPGFPRIPEVITAARAASRLTDPRLAQVFDVEDGGDQAYIVLEWVAGDSVADLVAGGPMDAGSACALVAEAASALAGAHASGQAHLMLRPGSLRWTRSSGVKITGLGIDAALAGAGLANASDPGVTDTRDLAGLLYAALTGYWPRESQTSLPPAPVSDGEVFTPRQVSADVPVGVDAAVTRALLQRPTRHGGPILAPSELADALTSVAPPMPLPEPAPVSRPFERYDNYGDRGAGQGGYDGYRQDGYGDRGYRQTGGFPDAPNPNDPSTWNTGGGGTAAYRRGYAGERGGTSRALVSVVVILVVAAVGAAIWGISTTLHSKGGSGNQAGVNGPSARSSSSAPAASGAVLKPASAQSFNPLGDGAEHQPDAMNPLTGTAPAWSFSHYSSPEFGQLKKGDGYLIDMGQKTKLSSVDVTFATPGTATAQIYVSDTTATQPGSKDWPQPGYTAVTQPAQVSGKYTFQVPASATAGRYVIIWFTQLTPSGTESISQVTVHGSAAAG